MRGHMNEYKTTVCETFLWGKAPTWLHRGIFWITLVAVMIIPSEAAKAAQLDGNQCLEINLSDELAWPTSGLWANGQDGQPELLIVDPMRNNFAGEVLRIKIDGAVEDAFGTGSGIGFKSLAGSVVPRMPTHLRLDARGAALLLEDTEPAGLAFLGKDLALTRRVDLGEKLGVKAASRGPAIQIDAIYDMVPLGDGGVLAFADVIVTARREADGERYVTGFVYFDGKGRTQIFREIGDSDDVFNQYTRNAPYMATLIDRGGKRGQEEEVAYVLFLDQKPTLAEVRYGAEIRDLDLFPGDFQSRPRLVRQHEMYGARQATLFYKTMEMSTMAAGLYSWAGNLYLLGKLPAEENGDTAWWLVRLDPATGGELSRVRLPTDAPNLTIVPGEHWALLQKDAVVGVGALHAPYMQTRSMVLVPNGWIADPDAGNLDVEARSDCTRLDD